MTNWLNLLTTQDDAPDASSDPNALRRRSNELLAELVESLGMTDVAEAGTVSTPREFITVPGEGQADSFGDEFPYLSVPAGQTEVDFEKGIVKSQNSRDVDSPIDTIRRLSDITQSMESSTKSKVRSLTLFFDDRVQLFLGNSENSVYIPGGQYVSFNDIDIDHFRFKTIEDRPLSMWGIAHTRATPPDIRKPNPNMSRILTYPKDDDGPVTVQTDTYTSIPVWPEGLYWDPYAQVRAWVRPYESFSVYVDNDNNSDGPIDVRVRARANIDTQSTNAWYVLAEDTNIPPSGITSFDFPDVKTSLIDIQARNTNNGDAIAVNGTINAQ